MGLFRSERGIGRGEIAESRIEAPFFAIFMMLCTAVILAVHLRFQNQNVTLALAVSLIVFGTTVVRVDYGVYILVMAMLFSPEIFAGHEYSGERPLNVRYDDVLIVVIFLGVLVKLAFEGRQSLWHPNPINLGIAAYYGVCIISTLLALRANLPAWDKRTGFFVMLKMAEFYMVFILVGNAIRTRAEVRRQLILFFIVAAIVCIYGVLQVGAGQRVSAPFESGGDTEPNTFGGYLTLVISIAIGLYVYAPTLRLKLLLCLFAIGAFVPFLFTLSRASYVALLAAIVTAGLYGRKPLLLVSVVGILLASPILMPEEVKDRVNYTFQRGAGEPVTVAGRETGIQVDKSTHERIYVWRKVWFILHVAPWFGGGVSWESVMDSQYARVILESGLFGITAFLFLQQLLFRTARQASRWSSDWLGRGLGLGMTAGVVGMVVHGIGTITFLIIRIMEPFWFLMALTVVMRTLALQEHAQRRASERARTAAANRGITPPTRGVQAPAADA
ncbi:MAG TPA: O-antigen ligase family protein [Candidatus Hydrogenedentes bacterium]|nr:O-antigen ligase family protein [Candidatus Hydrogenedentota bacterium]HPG65933.1 O-antigen ligase family protein [Candidatus Hydrogenedentota bacterium]